MNLLKFALKPFIIVCCFTLILFSCNKEESVSTPVTPTKSNIHALLVSEAHLEDTNPEVIKKVKRRNLEKNNNKTFFGEDIFHIETSQSQIIEQENSTTYTFYVYRDNPQPNTLENYTYKENNDGTFEQYLLKYYYEEDGEGNRVYSQYQFDVTLLTGESLIEKDLGGCVPHFARVFDGLACVTMSRCFGPGSSGQHEVGSTSCKCGGSIPTCFQAGTTVCNYQYKYVYQGCGASGEPSDTSDDGSFNIGGGGSNSNSEPLEDPVESLPFEDPTPIWEEALECANTNGDDHTYSADDLEGYGLTEAQWDRITAYLNSQSCSEDASHRVMWTFMLAFHQLENKCDGFDMAFGGFFEVNTPYTALMRDRFFSSANDHEIRMEESELPPNVSAQTGRRSTSDNSERIGMEFNTDYLKDASNLGTLVTIYHEMLHALMLSLHYEGTLLSHYPEYTALQIALDNAASDPTNIEFQAALKIEAHNIFVDFIDPIAISVVEYCSVNSISGVDLAYAKKLVWGSLYGNEVLSNELTEEEREEVGKLTKYEDRNTAGKAKGSRPCDE